MFRIDFFKWPISVISLGLICIIKSPNLKWSKSRDVSAIWSEKAPVFFMTFRFLIALKA